MSDKAMKLATIKSGRAARNMIARIGPLDWRSCLFLAPSRNCTHVDVGGEADIDWSR